MPDIYISPTGSDSNTGLTSSSPVLTASKVMTLLANKPGTEQTVYLRGGTYTSRLIFTNAKNGTADAPITIRNYPGERAVIAPTTGSTKFNYEYALSVRGDYWRIIGEAPSDRRDWDTYMIAVDGGCTGILDRTGLLFDPTGYTFVAGDFIRGMSCVQIQGTIASTAATIANNTAAIGGEVQYVGTKNSKKWGVTIIGNRGPTRIANCLAYKTQMDNYKQFLWTNYSSPWGFGIGIIAGSDIYGDNLGTYLPGPHVVDDNIVDHTWGESVGVYASTDVTIARNLIIEPQRMGIYSDANQRFQIIDNDIFIPSNPDIADRSFLWAMIVWSSEKADKVAQNGLIARNRLIGGNQGIVYGFKKTTGANPNNILHAHNVCIGQTTRAFGSTGDAMDDATVLFQNNVFDGPVPATVGNATWVRNAFSSAPASRCLGGGGFVNATLGLAKTGGLTKLGYTKEYCRPVSGSPLLQAGLAITSTPVGSLATDADGNAWDVPPTLGPFRSAVVDNAVSARVLALFFGGTSSSSALTINEVKVAESVDGADISGSATIRTSATISNPGNLTDSNVANAATSTADAAMLLTWLSPKTIAEIRLNVPATETAPTHLSAYAVEYVRGMPSLTFVGEWKAGERSSSGWLSFVVTPSVDIIAQRARAAIESLF